MVSTKKATKTKRVSEKTYKTEMKALLDNLEESTDKLSDYEEMMEEELDTIEPVTYTETQTGKIKTTIPKFPYENQINQTLRKIDRTLERLLPLVVPERQYKSISVNSEKEMIYRHTMDMMEGIQEFLGEYPKFTQYIYERELNGIIDGFTRFSNISK